MTKIAECRQGDMLLGYPWEVWTDYLVCGNDDAAPCKHCHSPVSAVAGPGGATYKVWVCPVAAVSKDREGHICSALCVKCLLEAFTTMEDLLKQSEHKTGTQQ